MQLAHLATNGPSVRSEIDGWTFEDSSLLIEGKPIGLTPGPKHIPHYTNIMEMLADGWVLLGPPTKEAWKNDCNEEISQWAWWLTRDKSERPAYVFRNSGHDGY